MKNKNGIWVITLFCVFFSFFISTTLETPGVKMEVGGTTSIQKIAELLDKKKDLLNNKESLLDKARTYEAIIAEYEEQAAKSNSQGKIAVDEIKNARILAGLVDLHGPGIEITLDDRKRDTIFFNNPSFLSFYIVHDSDLLAIVNELKAAGAEAIAINDVRIIETSRISCGGPTISIGKEQRFAPPFTIHAIGEPEALMSYFTKRKDSIYNDLVFWGLEFNIKKVEDILIPRYIGDTKFYYAEKEGE